MTNLLASLGLALGLLQQTPASPGTYTMSFPSVDAGGPVRYALTIPRGYKAGEPRPLILALHPGGQRFPGYGGAFVQQVVAPGLADLGAIIVAPDVPTRAWTDAPSERAVMALLNSVLAQYAVDRARVLVTGFSLGGRGTWFLSSRHADLFTAAIVMAGSPGEAPIDTLASVPTYVIHSHDDEVAPFAPTERAVNELKRLGRPIEFRDLYGPTHYDMGAYVAPLRAAGRWVAQRWKK